MSSAAGFRVEAVTGLEKTLDIAFAVTGRPVVAPVVADVVTENSSGLDPLTSTLQYHDVEETRAQHVGGDAIP